jgi:hypothetical protein
VNGSGFVSGSQVNFNMVNVATMFVGPMQLNASIPASAIVTVGYPNVTVTNPGGLVSVPVPFTVVNPQPGGGSVAPPSVLAGANALTLSVSGTGFDANSVVFVNDSARVTIFKSSTLLVATLLPGDLAQAGTLNITVVNPLPGGGTSPVIAFPVNNPVPQESSLSPSSVSAGSAALTVAVVGSNFNLSSTILVNGTALLTTHVSASVLEVTLPASDLAQGGTLNISVVNPPPGGGKSQEILFPVNNPIPQASSLSPSSVAAGSAALTVAVVGSNFNLSSIILVNGIALPTTYVSATLLDATLLASDLAQGGTLNASVMNPAPGGGATPVIAFIVNNPAPQVNSVSPSSVLAGSGPLALEVIGTNFNGSSKVMMNGVVLVTMFVSSTHLQASVPASDLTQVGAQSVSVNNPSPGGGTSAPIQFTVTVADYAVTGPPSPAKVNAGGSAVFILTVAPIGGEYTYPITFTATGLPPDGSASFTPSTPVTPGASTQTVTLSISTMPHSATSTINFPRRSHPELLVPLLAGMAFGLGGFWLFTLRGRAKRLVPQLLLALLISAVVGLVACGAVGGGTPPSPQVNPATGTPAGTYSIEVKAASGGLSHSTTVTLTVV